MRIDDVDTPRIVKGAADKILRTLEALNLFWDEEVVYQSQRSSFYIDALHRLAESGTSFACACTRKGLAGVRYPGTCRNGIPSGTPARSVRVITDTDPISFIDGVQGLFEQDLAHQVGDFVIHRGDGQIAYHLATVIDDAAQQVSEVVRGSDLLESTPRQIFLQHLLAVPTPRYAHLPVAIDKAGQKLSKQTHARALDHTRLAEHAHHALMFLGHTPPKELLGAPLDSLWTWATANWDLNRVPVQKQLPEVGELS